MDSGTTVAEKHKAIASSKNSGAGWRMPRRTRSPSLDFNVLAIHALLLCDVAFNSRLFLIIPSPFLQPLLLGACIVFGVAFGILLILEGDVVPILAASSVVLLIAWQMTVFSQTTNIPIFVNASFQFVWTLALVPFTYWIKRGYANAIVDRYVNLAVAYSVLFLLLSLASFLRVLPSAITAPITLSDPERGARLFYYGALCALGWYARLQTLLREQSCKNWILAIICLLAVLASISRVSILIIFLITVLYLSRLRDRQIGSICGVLFVIGAGQNLVGLIDVSLNPYSYFSGDSSGSYRILEYELARIFIHKDPIFGFGLAPSSEAAGALLINPYFAAGDIGPTGVWFEWGVFGLVVFLLGTAITFRPIRLVSERSWRRPLYLMGVYMGLYGCIAPIITAGSASLFALIFSLWLHEIRTQRSRLRNVE